jgi:hypothetical protein
MKSFFFWQRWFFFSSLLFAMFGIILTVYGNNPLFRPYNNALAQIFGFGESMPASMEPFRAFVWGPIGATITRAYILLAFIAWYPFQRKERWARTAILVAFHVFII